MIAFGVSITKPDVYDVAAGPGIRLAAEPDSQVLAFNATGSIFRSYNLLMEKAAAFDDLEALVLVHQDAEIVDPGFCAKVRSALADPDVGLVGCVGAIGVRSIAWWEGSVTWASFSHKYGEFGGGEVESFSWHPGKLPPYARTGEVDTVDGFVMCLSPWIVRNLRFDESLGQLHGYDFDFCLQVREAGRKVVTEDLRVKHHHSLELVSDPETWIQAHIRVAEKWEGRMPGEQPPFDGDWRARARRAEADAAVNRLQVAAIELQHEAQLAQIQRDVEELTGSVSWKLTQPLRLANDRRRRLRASGRLPLSRRAADA